MSEHRKTDQAFSHRNCKVILEIYFRFNDRHERCRFEGCRAEPTAGEAQVSSCGSVHHQQRVLRKIQLLWNESDLSSLLDSEVVV